MDRKLHRRSIKDASNPLECPDNEFHRLFRLNKIMALYLSEELNNALQPRNPRDGLPVHIKGILDTPELMTTDRGAAPNSAADKYTRWHYQVCSCVERANGYIKPTNILI